MRFLVLFLFPVLVFAQQTFPRDVTFSWDNASAYTDGTLMEPGDLTGVRVECFRQNDTVPLITANFPAIGEGQPQTETLTGVIPQPGTYTCVAYSIVIGGIESLASNADSVKHVGRPNPPVNFTVG